VCWAGKVEAVLGTAQEAFTEKSPSRWRSATG
jgi:hypothetical protein